MVGPTSDATHTGRPRRRPILSRRSSRRLFWTLGVESLDRSKSEPTRIGTASVVELARNGPFSGTDSTASTNWPLPAPWGGRRLS